jgi:hypothetical protein
MARAVDVKPAAATPIAGNPRTKKSLRSIAFLLGLIGQVGGFIARGMGRQKVSNTPTLSMDRVGESNP